MLYICKMYGSNKNNTGKIEKNKRVKEGDCIFPFRYKHKLHDTCFETDKGDICATTVNNRKTLQTYGYCIPKQKSKKRTKEKALKKTTQKKKRIKLILQESPKETSNHTYLKTKQYSKYHTFHTRKNMEGKTKTKTSQQHYNEQFSKVLGQLHTMMVSKGEPFRARAYKKAQETIMSITTPITDLKQLKGKPGIGETILQKLDEYIKTGTLQMIEREKSNPIYIFTQIYGIGPKKAKELVEKHNIKTITELRKNQDILNDKQKIGLEYYEDILQRIPRSEIDEYKNALQDVFDDVEKNYKGSSFEIVGSYRRGAKDSGDIDIILTNSQNDNKLLDDFVDKLQKKGLVIEILSKGDIKSLTIGRLNTSKPARRLDFMYASPEEYAFSILYFTGSASFNTVMRQQALNIGYSMNEHGLYKMMNGKKTSKLDMFFKTEKDIFDFLKMEYKAPEERIDGTAVKIVEDMDGTTKTKQAKKTLKKPKLKILETYSSEIHGNNFIKEGIDYLHTLDEKTLIELLRDSNDAYYNKTPFLTDTQFDILKEYIESKYPKNKAIKEIGAPIEKNKVKLPYFMGSMDKIKPDTTALTKWISKYKGPYILSAKLDGISALYYIDTNTNTRKLYTRGNGIEGQDISHLLPYLDLPDISKSPKTSVTVTDSQIYAIRGELIMKKHTFDTKYSKEASNSRNLVAGIVNSKTPSPSKYKDVDFVAYEVIEPHIKPSIQFDYLKTNGFIYAQNQSIEKSKISNSYLSETLISWRENYEYEIDGVIVAQDSIFERKKGNPEHAFAFKMVLSDQVVEAKVVDVLWTPSKDGYLKPRIRIEPVIIGGAKIEYATAFNGAFVEEKKIGIGAVIQLVRSGDVIPHIMDVITPAPQAKMPDVEYIWNDTHVDILLVDAGSDEIVREKTITAFFVGLGVTGLSSGNIRRIISAGFDTIPKILHMKEIDFLKVDGFKDKMAKKVYTSIRTQIEKATLSKLMSVSNIFGRGMGEKRIDVVLEKYPNILTDTKTTHTQKIENIIKLSGFAKKTAELFVSNIDRFLKFIEEAGLQHKLKIKTDVTVEKDESHPLFGKSIVMTGFRDKTIEERIKSYGGKIGSSVSKNTFIVLVKDLDETTGKAGKAKKLGVTLMLPEQFNKKYFMD